jgi:putative acetyltransferase
MSPLIRFEVATDAPSIAKVVEDAFRGHPHSDGSEPRIVTRLRTDGDLSISLVAEVAGEVIGHVAFSPVSITPAVAAWYGLGPLAVHPVHQSRGIGSALVLRGLSELQAAGAAGCVVFGNAAFYGRFGFRSCPGLVYPHGPKERFHARAFEGTVPIGVVAYSAAFGAD